MTSIRWTRPLLLVVVPLVLVAGAPHAEGMMVGYAHALVPPLVQFLDREL